MPVLLTTPLAGLVGAKATKLRDLGAETVGDLLHHYPSRYVDLGDLTDFRALPAEGPVTVLGRVASVQSRQVGRGGLWKTDIRIEDERRRELVLTVFGRQWQVKRDLPLGRRAYFSGSIEVFREKRQIKNPTWVPVDETAEARPVLAAVYPEKGKAKNKVINEAVDIVLPQLVVEADPLPPEVRDQQRLPGLLQALQRVHRPQTTEQAYRARRRLLWDEAFTVQVELAQRRAALARTPAVPRLAGDDGVRAAFDRSLPFVLTQGQREVGAQLEADLARTLPMQRLLQGEVGSGKTLVALRAMLTVVDAGGQAALLAPTEVLAQQHARSLRALLGPLARAGELGAPERATRVALLTGSLGPAARREALAETRSGAAGIVVGTHALLSEGVDFADLGLVVVDEQHRFGVEQRDALRAKGDVPHLLVMTATPIPRTIAMTVYGDLEISTMRERPPGRSPVRTAVVPLAEKPAWVATVWQRVREAAAEGHQSFVVCPRIVGDDEDLVDRADDIDPTGGDDLAGDGGAGGADDPDGPPERPPLAAVEEVAPRLLAGELAGLRVAALHGRLPADEKEDAMRRFSEGDLDVLVATTVVEVGVDVPGAAVMVVLDAQQFGISQLHQLRGRIGRGSVPGLCLLVTTAPAGSPARERLDAVASTDDGFVLAQLDLEQRKEGDVLGARQSGRSSLRLLRVLKHGELVASARAAAAELVASDPDLSRHPALRAAVAVRVGQEGGDFLEKT